MPEEFVLVRSQPAVFMILVTGKFKVDYPSTVSIKRSSGESPGEQAEASSPEQKIEDSAGTSKSLLEIEYHSDLKDGVIDTTKNKLDYYWEKISTNPVKYLEFGKNITSDFTEKYSHGTGFAVSREGIFLTNAHVIEDPPPGVIPPALMDELILRFLKDCQFLKILEKEL